MKKEKGSVLPGAMDNDNQILHSVVAVPTIFQVLALSSSDN